MNFVGNVLKCVLVALLFSMCVATLAVPFFWLIYMARETGSAVYVACSLGYVMLVVGAAVIFLEWLHHGWI